ncbi:FitA-like ribbon-helix-helix domain-containing protein [Leifsonia poae]|uniref:FitA-like ribbon-helix-helix domain-containing protein n=1 Tax=Leifsonia poae TaxID=110933 RepID=UPI003D68A681
MGVTVQVRDLDPTVDDRLKRAAAEKGLSYSEFLRRELTRMAEKLRIEDRWNELKAAHEARVAAVSQSAEPLPRFDFTTDEIIHAIHEGRKGR